MLFVSIEQVGPIGLLWHTTGRDGDVAGALNKTDAQMIQLMHTSTH